MIYTIKKDNESGERLMNRFKKIIKRSRILMDAKKKRFRIHKPTKKFVRQAAVMRAGHRKRREIEQLAN
ncbi:30S ribosomal protein S21 [Candidatus Peregrinibacteria bacterium CG_4_10_14_0_2_um_filter_43_11]|nr:MAG: 30S ribosomal protein S21 [Candidatus Peregrinibacteria bacterium CG_4_10_14_0_2_um_filter_43_11]